MKVYNEETLLKLFDFIKTYQSRSGKSPSYRELQRKMGFSSLSVAHRYVQLLVQKQMIDKDKNGGIAIRDNLKPSSTTLAPVVGIVTCGKPIYAQEDIEAMVELPSNIFGSDETFILHAEGDSMINAGIKNGDLLVVKKKDSAENGDIVVALLGDSATVKTFYKKSDCVVLHPENEKYDDIKTKDVKILGKVQFVIHKF